MRFDGETINWNLRLQLLKKLVWHSCANNFENGNNRWRNSPGRYDTMFINTTHSDTDDDAGSSSVHGFLGLEVVRACLFFSFVHEGVKYPCALVHWFSRPSNVPSDFMGMYTLEPDHNRNSQPVTAVIHLDTVFRAAHLLPVFHNHPALLKHQRFEQTLNLFSEFYINHYIDHHAFELVSQCLPYCNVSY